ncbi:unnamed protein product [Phaeothamnion confervicola]
MHVAVFVIPETGHISGITGVSNELLLRGHKVSIFSTDACIRAGANGATCNWSVREMLEQRVPGAELMLTAAPALSVTEFGEMLDDMMVAKPLDAISFAINLTYEGTAECLMAAAARHRAAGGAIPFDVIVADFSTPCGTLAAEILDLPLIRANPVPLSAVSRENFAFLTPSMLLGRSWESLLWFPGRLAATAEHLLELFVVKVYKDRLNEERVKLGLPAVGLLEVANWDYSPTIRDGWVIQNSFWGLETTRPVSPRIFLVGTSFDVEAVQRSVAAAAAAAAVTGAAGSAAMVAAAGGRVGGVAKALLGRRGRRAGGSGDGDGKGSSDKGDDKRCCGADAATSAGNERGGGDGSSGIGPGGEALAWLNEADRRPVVYISLGTVTRPKPKQFAAILSALAPLPVDVLLSVREDMQPRLPSPLLPVAPAAAAGRCGAVADSCSTTEAAAAAGAADATAAGQERVALFPTVPQLEVLAHPRVVAFVSHCGGNSVPESLALGKPIIGVPQLWDQLTLCSQAASAGAAVCVPMASPEFGIPALQEAARRIAIDANEAPLFRAAAERQAALLRFAGGARRAADVVELAHAVGVNAMHNPLDGLPLAVRLHLDVAAAALAVTAMLLFALALLLWGSSRAVRFAARRLLSFFHDDGDGTVAAEAGVDAGSSRRNGVQKAAAVRMSSVTRATAAASSPSIMMEGSPAARLRSRTRGPP